MKVFPNGAAVVTPKGRGMVVNDSHPDTRDVRFPDKEAGSRIETFSLDELTPAPKLDDKVLSKRALKIIDGKVDEVAKPYRNSSVQKNVKAP